MFILLIILNFEHFTSCGARPLRLGFDRLSLAQGKRPGRIEGRQSFVALPLRFKNAKLENINSYGTIIAGDCCR
jgi:hypothetical protein